MHLIIIDILGDQTIIPLTTFGHLDPLNHLLMMTWRPCTLILSGIFCAFLFPVYLFATNIYYNLFCLGIFCTKNSFHSFFHLLLLFFFNFFSMSGSRIDKRPGGRVGDLPKTATRTVANTSSSSSTPSVRLTFNKSKTTTATTIAAPSSSNLKTHASISANPNEPDPTYVKDLGPAFDMFANPASVFYSGNPEVDWGIRDGTAHEHPMVTDFIFKIRNKFPILGMHDPQFPEMVLYIKIHMESVAPDYHVQFIKKFIERTLNRRPDFFNAVSHMYAAELKNFTFIEIFEALRGQPQKKS
jgi:hypothetical protein